VHDGAHTAVVVAPGGHGQVAKVKLHEVLNLASLNVQHHGVVDLQKLGRLPKRDEYA